MELLEVRLEQERSSTVHSVGEREELRARCSALEAEARRAREEVEEARGRLRDEQAAQAARVGARLDWTGLNCKALH